MTAEANPSALFTPGLPAGVPPAGDVEREAVASLKGYAYQVIVATLAWLDLNEREELYLEVAEDYATVAEQSLNAVQVKDTAGSGAVTLNTTGVRDAITAFVDLFEKNRQRDVSLRYFTTSAIGTELKVSDRPEGEAGLNYWRKAAAGADLQPLRAKLTSGEYSPEVDTFVRQRNDDELRRDLLRRIHWDAGQPDIAGVTNELEERLVVLGRDKFGIAGQDARRLAQPLIYHVLKTSVLKNRTERVLTRADLYSSIDAATQLVVSRQAASAITQLGPILSAALIGAQGSEGSFAAADLTWLVPGDELPVPRAIISRPKLTSTIEACLLSYGQAILVGASGLGKSIAARGAAASKKGKFATIDFRGMEVSEVVRRLDLTLGRIGMIDCDCLIFDDFNEIEDGRARIGFARCLQALRRRDRTAVATSYRRPSQRALTELGLPGEAVINISYLTEHEAEAIVRVAAGDEKQWGKIAYAAGAQGHPQLTHAFAMGMAARGWPRAAMSDVIIRGFASDDTDAEREAARRSIVTALSDNARQLLYRLSLILGRFDRDLALRVGQAAPAIATPGELLDELVGPWVEAVGKNAYRVSPLASNAGQGMLNVDEQRAIHQVIAVQKLAARKINVSEANSILTHALLGKSLPSLLGVAHSVLTAGEQAIEALQEHFIMLQVLRTDQPIFEDNRMVSTMLRMAQFKLFAAKGKSKEIVECANALFREVDEEQDPEIRDVLEVGAHACVLYTIGIASYLPDWLDLLQRFKAKAESNPELRELVVNTEAAMAEEGLTVYGIMFTIGSAKLNTVQRLEEILLDLDRLTPVDRSLWLESFDQKPGEYAILVNGPWTEELRKNQLSAAEAASRYERMGALALRWNKRALAAHCVAARVVMIDEYLNDQTAAHAAIDHAIDELGAEVVLLRARAKLFWRHDKHAEAVAVARGIADVVGLDSPIERAFALREAAISAAKMEDWQLASDWFGAAQVAAAQLSIDSMQLMAVGLRADAAVAKLKSGRTKEALGEMSKCLARLQSINPEASLKAAYCHRVIRHAVLWMDTEIDEREAFIDGKPITMLPGACSNPEPPSAIAETPLSPLDLAWYMLADAEISSGLDAGVDRSLDDKLQGGRIPFMEISKETRRITRAVITTDTARFAGSLAAHLAGIEHLRSNALPMQETFDIMAPATGAVQVLSAEQLSSPSVTVVAEDALIGFGLAAALQGRAVPIDDLAAELTSIFGASFPGRAVIDNWRGLRSDLTSLDNVVSEQITLLNSSAHLEPRKIWEIGLRAFEKIRQSAFRRALAPLLGKWLRAQWRRIIENESFRISRPKLTVPLVEARLAIEANNETFVASLLLATAEAIGSPLAPQYERHLRDIASGEASAPSG